MKKFSIVSVISLVLIMMIVFVSSGQFDDKLKLDKIKLDKQVGEHIENYGQVTSIDVIDGFTEKKTNRNKVISYKDSNDIILIANQVEWCESKPDSINDGWKTCHSVIEIINEGNKNIDLLSASNKFKFDFSGTLKSSPVYYVSHDYDISSKSDLVDEYKEKKWKDFEAIY